MLTIESYFQVVKFLKYVCIFFSKHHKAFYLPILASVRVSRPSFRKESQEVSEK